MKTITVRPARGAMGNTAISAARKEKTAMEERIQKIIAARSGVSRRRAEEMIRAGRVRLNGNTAALGERADPDEDVIEVDGVRLPKPPEHVYLMLNKPRGFVTTMSDEQGRRTVCELVADCGARVYPVGRLDLNSEGLLLMTNDGEFANRVMHPSHEIAKTYLAWVNGFTADKLQRLTQMRAVDNEPVSAARIRLISAKGDGALLSMTIHEGKNRQIRRMCAQAELRVTRLRRISEGPVQLGELASGAWRPLTEAEISALMQRP